MNHLAKLVSFGLLVSISSACSMFGSEEPMYTSGTIEENAVTVTARVTAIDHSTRSVSLRTEDGLTINFVAAPDVRNLDQVEAGDVVRTTYYESVVYQLKKPGDATPGVVVAGDAARAEPGEKPGAGAARMIMVTATVTAIDAKNSLVTLEAPDGERRAIRVRDPDRLKGVKVGDLVEFTYTQAVAIGVEEVGD